MWQNKTNQNMTKLKKIKKNLNMTKQKIKM